MKPRLQFWIAIAVCIVPGIAMAQGLLQNNLGHNNDQPVQIEAASLEVHDKAKTATFSGNVQVVQGDTTMKCQSLVVFYGHEVGIAQSAAGGSKQASAAPGPKGAQDIRRIEARGGVIVATKDQNAKGDLGVYDLQAKTITLTGNVTVSQGANVIRGERVIVDTVTGNARVLSGESGGAARGAPVRALITPSKNQNGEPGNIMTIGPGRAN